MPALIASGNFGSPAIWSDGIVPSYPCTIDTAGFELTVDDERTVGTSPAASASTYDVTTGATGKIIIAPTGHLRVRGHYYIDASPADFSVGLELQDGAQLEFDSSLAPDPLTDSYKLQVGTTGGYRYRRIQGRGAFRIFSTEGYATAYFSGGYGGVNIDFQGEGKTWWIERFNNPANDIALPFPAGSDSNALSIAEEGILSECGMVRSGIAFPSSATFRWQHVGFISSVGTYNLYLSLTAKAAGERILHDLAFDKSYRWSSAADPHGVEVTECSFPDHYSWHGTAHDVWEDNFVRVTAQSRAPATLMLREYRVVDRTISNQKGLQFNEEFRTRVVNSIQEPLGATGTDGEYSNGGAHLSGEQEISGSIFIPHRDGSANRFVEFATNNAGRVSCYHNTVAAQGASIGLGHVGHDITTPDRTRSKSNIFANFDASPADKIGYISVDVPDCVDPAEVSHNLSWGNFNPGRYTGWPDGYTYASSTPASVPGANDIDGVDPWPHWSEDLATRIDQLPRLVNFGKALGLTGTDAEIEDRVIEALNYRHLPAHEKYLAGVSPTEIYDWVYSRWAPSESLLVAAGHDGEDIGAVAYAAVSSGGSSAFTTRARRRRWMS